MVGRTSDWKEELGQFLKPFLDRLGHKARRQMCPLYVSGLIGPGDRKSIQPMAKRLALGECDQLHHFIAAGVWDATPVETELLVQADRLVGGSDAVLVIDDTAIPKKGTHSVGVAPQYASALGKTSNCQTLVSLTLARGEVPVMLALRLFLPESWTSKRARLERAGVPAEYRTARTKPEIALAEIDRIVAAGVRFGCVLADAGYGLSAPFRQELAARKLTWAVGIPRHLKVYPADVRMIWPVAKRGRPRQRYIPDILSIPAEECWPMPNGTPSVGALARKESSRLVLLLPTCGSPTDRRSGSGTKASNICPGTRLGSSANTGCRERRNTISPTCRRRLTCAP
jgi:SRSO17 transposase